MAAKPATAANGGDNYIWTTSRSLAGTGPPRKRGGPGRLINQRLSRMDDATNLAEPARFQAESNFSAIAGRLLKLCSHFARKYTGGHVG
jgi:hypothetical protein